MMQEAIGNVVLHFDQYTGEDLYCDGSVEDELLEIVKTTAETDYDQVITNNPQWPIFYHLSALRQNVLNWFSFDKGKSALEIGSGCGALTGFLSDSCKAVDCVELSKKRSLINAYRNRKKNNVSIFVSEIEQFFASCKKTYDYVVIIGVLEYSGSFVKTGTPYLDFLRMAKQLLNEDGQLILAIENRLGMKYWAGCREDHLGTYFSGIEGYPDNPGIRTFTKAELTDLLCDVGLNSFNFYYPYPDYKFPRMIFSDQWLPKEGELTDNRRNFDADRLVLFDEARVFDAVIQEGLFPTFSNSYLVVARKGAHKNV